MNHKTFRGEQLKKARLLRGLTLTELAGQTGVSKQSISLYENNGNCPEYERGMKIANALNVPYEFFLQEDSYSTSTEAIYFRSLVSATKMDRTVQSLKLEYVAKIYEVLAEHVNFPALHLPKIEFWGNDNEFDEQGSVAELKEIERIAMQTREYWNLGTDPISNLQFTLEENGLVVTGFDTNESKIDAFSQRTLLKSQGTNQGEMFLIAVDQGTKPRGRIRFDLAHELAHVLLHPWSEGLDMIPKEEFKHREVQANMFAGAFLLPAESFIRDIQAYPTDLKYYLWLKKKWQVSVSAMVYRSRQLGIITSNQHQYMMRQISKNGWRKQEPDDEPYFLNENIFQGALDLLFEQRILTPASFMKLLARRGINLFPSDVEDVLHLRAGTLEASESKPQIIQLKFPKKTD
jgi:Zn-dependent peptidase ImmA (M78 family)/DNA-binding XRE family transcriptional regulator